MLLQCLLLVLASFALEPTSYENTIYRFTLDQMGTENDVEEFRKSLTKELGQNATVEMSTRFREGKLHRLNLRLTNKGGMDITFKVIGFQAFHLGIELDEQNLLTGLKYGFDQEKITSVDLQKEKRMRVRRIHKETESE